MNKLFKLTICFVFAFLLNVGVCYASTSESVTTASYLEMYSGMFANEINSPYQAEQSDGMVDTSSGTMEVNVEDLYIPGKNGLDLSVKRHFNTLTSPMSYYVKNESDPAKECIVGYYRDYLCVEKNEVITIIFDNEEELIDAGEEFTGIHPSERMGFISYDDIYYDELHVIRGTYTYTLYDRTITPKTKSTTHYHTAYTYKFDGGYLNMENGWVLQVPSIEKYDYYQITGYKRYYMIFQDRLGRIYTYDYEITKDDEEDSEWELDSVNIRECNPFEFQYVNNKKIKETAIHPNGFTYTSTITMENGDVYYFFTDGVSANQKLKAIEDKYGNIILFEVNYIDTKITDYVITDTYGNVYTVNQNGITKGTGDSVKELVKYEWELNINSTEDVYNEYTLDNTHILTVTKNTGTSNLISDTEPNKTKYYHMQKCQFKYPLRDGSYLMYKLPYKVETPDGTSKYFEYDMFDEWEIGLYPKTYPGRLYYVDKCYETFGNKTNNIVEYEYNIVLGHSDINYLYDSTERYYDGQTLIKTVETTYDTEKDGDPPINIKITDAINGDVVEYDYTYMGSSYPPELVASETYTYGDYSHTKTYDYTFGGLIFEEVNGDYECDYRYYNDNYYLPHTISYKKDANTTVKTENLLTTDGKSIASQKVYENDVLKSTTNFTYDTYGNVISSSTLKDDGTYATTNYTYTYGTTSYTVTATYTGLVNADGDAIDNITTSKTYDYQNNLLSETDGNENTTSYTYDNANRLTKVTYPNGTYDTYSYDITNNVTTLTTRTGAVYKVYFDGNGNAVKYTKGNDITEQAEYDSIGRLIEYQRIYSPTNKTKVNYTYDYLDRITSETVYDNNTQISSATFAYSAGEDANDRITNTITKTVPGFATEQSTTDYMGNVITSKMYTSDSERVYTYTYDYVGNMLTQTNPKNQTDTFTYDYANRVATHTNADNNTKSYTYNKLGQLITETDYNGNSTYYVYDNLGRNLTTSMQNGALTKTYYDANSNVIKTQTKSNVQGETDKYDTVEYAYDVFNRLSSSKQYANDTTPVYTNYWRSHLEAELLVTYGDDNNSVWDLGTDTAQIDYSIDPYGNVTAMTTHNIMESYFYDYQGRMITQNQGKTGPYDMKTTAYAYNGFDNITSKTATLPNGNSQSISYTYNQLGLRTSMTDSTGTTTYAYTPFGELLSETKGTTVKNYAYDNMGNRTLFTLTMDGTQNLNTSYTYDVLNRLASVTQSYNTVSYTYDNNSNLLQTVKADGSIENYTYNNVNQLTQKVRSLNGVEKESYAYTYYLNGNIRTQNETLPAIVNHTYTYDGMGRLTNETVSGSYTRNDTYTYDKRGNRTSLVSLDGTTTYTYNKNNQILEKRKTTSAGTEFNNYAYDDYGNRIQDAYTMLDGLCDLRLYEYDAFNRLTFDNWFGTFAYDGDNIRQTVDNYAQPITEIYDGGNLVARKQGTNTHVYIYGLEQEFYMSGYDFGIYSTNHRGDISKEIHLNSGNEKTRAYSAYGTSIASAYSNISPFGYAGEVTGNTGLVYLRNRYYDPETGTFLTQDPIKDGMNWYAYCAGNPVMFVDPWGLYEPGDEKYKESNPIVYAALGDLTNTWNKLDNLEKQGIDIGNMKNEVHELANAVRKIGDSKKVVDTPIIKNRLNDVEKVLFNEYPIQGAVFLEKGMESRYKTEIEYGNGYSVNDKADAFRHSYFYATLTRKIGGEITRMYANAHEYGFSDNFTPEHFLGTKMDLYNNMIGIKIGENSKTDEGIERGISYNMQIGNLLIIVNAKLVPSSYAEVIAPIN